MVGFRGTIRAGNNSGHSSSRRMSHTSEAGQMNMSQTDIKAEPLFRHYTRSICVEFRKFATLNHRRWLASHSNRYTDCRIVQIKSTALHLGSVEDNGPEAARSKEDGDTWNTDRKQQQLSIDPPQFSSASDDPRLLIWVYRWLVVNR